MGKFLLSFYLGGIEINEQLSLRNSLKAPLISGELDELCFSHNVYDSCIEINEQLSQRNSLNAFCYRLNGVNWFPPRIGVCMSGNWT